MLVRRCAHCLIDSHPSAFSPDYGYLYRKRKLTNRWMREFVLLVDSEVHYYTTANDPVDQPAGTFYIATNSGKAFHVKQSSKRPHCIGVINPSRTFYLAAETEREYLCWVNAIHQCVKRLVSRKAQDVSAQQCSVSLSCSHFSPRAVCPSRSTARPREDAAVRACLHRQRKALNPPNSLAPNFPSQGSIFVERCDSECATVY